VRFRVEIAGPRSTRTQRSAACYEATRPVTSRLVLDQLAELSRGVIEIDDAIAGGGYRVPRARGLVVISDDPDRARAGSGIKRDDAPLR